MRDTRIAVAGLRWWGPSPRDFSDAAERFVVKPVTLANLGSPLGRRVLKLPAAGRILTGTGALIGGVGVDMMVILAPHRVPEIVIKQLRRRIKLAAWLGDDPTGPRAIPYSLKNFDAVFAADTRWAPGSRCLPWPHLVPVELRLPVDPPRDGYGVIVGTPYPERVAAARTLIARGWDLTALGRGWPADIASRPTMDRLETLRWIRTERRLVVNVPHGQMIRTLNPFFFDVAAAGLVQIYLGAPNQSARQFVSGDLFESIEELEQLTNETIALQASELQSRVLKDSSVDARLTTITREVSLEP